MTLIGRRLGVYQVDSLLGAGGMGEVYRARDTRLGREVAIKILPDSFVADRERLARFEREARLLASLNHPTIAQIYGLDGDPPFIVMAFSSSRSGHRNLWMAKVDGTEATPLTTEAAIDDRPAFSRDGQQIAFVSDRGGQRGIWIMASTRRR